ncbi:collagen-like repeat preface domain-containing protein [Paenibacillus antarcticus]|uniref:Collagen-like repeat preface domain-containing protein n=1 Tax=Paenibacillus antarcticus TaxID=253703 RepID=A0A162MCF8_9BACL|nr:collagen-like repeat preface domain-containing protein [Paenibacillus antarcticus]OAB47105.1 hypothetical protein PBAT_08025 [Paenibacillus antarcticus]
MNAFLPCNGEAQTLLSIIIELGEVVPPALTNPTILNIANLHNVLQELRLFVINSNFEVDPTEILSILELTIVSTEVTPFSVTSVGTNLQQLLEQLLAYVLVYSPCL